MKKCGKCKKLKSNDYFHRSNRTKDGLCWACKKCESERILAYYHKRMKEEGFRIKERKRKLEEYYENPLKDRIKCAKRNAMKLNQTPSDADHTRIENLYLWAEVFGLLDGKKYHVDHIIPLSKGGLHHEDNLQILEATQNLRKHNKTDADIMGFSYHTLRAMYKGE